MQWSHNAPVTLCDSNRRNLSVLRSNLSWVVVRYFLVNLTSGLTQKNYTTMCYKSQDCSTTCGTINRAITKDLFTIERSWSRLVTTFSRPTHDHCTTTEECIAPILRQPKTDAGPPASGPAIGCDRLRQVSACLSLSCVYRVSIMRQVSTCRTTSRAIGVMGIYTRTVSILIITDCLPQRQHLLQARASYTSRWSRK
jgi:hypothetical protein